MHALFTQLRAIGAISDSLAPFAERTRDRGDIKALVCQEHGVIILDRIDQARRQHYEDKAETGTIRAFDRNLPSSPPEMDHARRAALLEPLLNNTVNWLDFGCGNGELLRSFRHRCHAIGLEINASRAAICRSQGLQIVTSLQELSVRPSLVTLFHVFEHLPDQVGELRTILGNCAPSARILIEVPHARDALLTLYRCEAYKRFTIWSEHLVLHTRRSLLRVVEAACDGIEAEVTLSAVQRYPLSNHLHWLSVGEPGGHTKFPVLGFEFLPYYESELARIDRTDTLLCEIVLS